MTESEREGVAPSPAHLYLEQRVDALERRVRDLGRAREADDEYRREMMERGE